MEECGERRQTDYRAEVHKQGAKRKANVRFYTADGPRRKEPVNRIKPCSMKTAATEEIIMYHIERYKRNPVVDYPEREWSRWSWKRRWRCSVFF